MSMMTSAILKTVDTPKIEKSKYLVNKTLFLSSTKQIRSLYIKYYNMAKNS